MKHAIIALAGAIVALGFLVSSAVANFLFGASLGRTPWEAAIYGSVGVLAVAMNALAPFYISWSLVAARKMTAVGIGMLWALCLIYSTTSALGFAAQNREGITLSRQITRDSYEDIRRELLDLEAQREDARTRDRARLDKKIDDARQRLATVRNENPAPADAQSQFLSTLTFGFLDPRHIRTALVTLFAVMVEMCATLGLFAALSHSLERPPPAANRWKPKASSNR